MSKSLVRTYSGCTKYFVELCKGTDRICESDLSGPNRLTNQENLFTPTPHSVQCVGENTAILGRASRLAYATKTLCDAGSTVKV